MKKIINIGLVAHVDAGKTTLTEQLLFHSGAIRSVGSVDNGTARTDYLSVERERGISVKDSSVGFEYNGIQINLIDTPGHADFVSEVERALTALDCAVVIVSGVEGIQAQTEVIIESIIRMKLPFVVFINKIDRNASISGKVFQSIKQFIAKSGYEALAFNTVSGEGTDECKCHEIDYTLKENQEELVTELSDNNEILLEKYLENGFLSSMEIDDAVRSEIKSNLLVPVVFGSSKYGIGADELLKLISRYMPTANGNAEEKMSGVIYKVEHDKAIGKLSYVRMFNGKIKNRESIFVSKEKNEEKVTQIKTCFGKKQSDIAEVSAGETAALCGLNSAKAGDIIGDGVFPRKPVSMAMPILKERVIPDNEEQLTELVTALGELSDEDPLLDFEWVTEKRELHIKITGSIQTEILALILKERYNIPVSFSEPSVIYKETPISKGIGIERYTMPKPCWAVVHFEIEPLPRGSGLEYSSIVPNKKILYRYQNHVETAVPRALKQGLFGWEVTDLKVTLIDGEDHHIHTHPLDFFVATPMGIMNGLENCKTKLLEPIMLMRFSAQEDFLGKTIGMAISARGEFDSPTVKDGIFTLEAKIPVAESLNIPKDFAVMTGGRGVISSRFYRYEDCPDGLGKSTERIGIDPRNRSKFILHSRQAL